MLDEIFIGLIQVPIGLKLVGLMERVGNCWSKMDLMSLGQFFSMKEMGELICIFMSNWTVSKEILGDSSIRLFQHGYCWCNVCTLLILFVRNTACDVALNRFTTTFRDSQQLVIIYVKQSKINYQLFSFARIRVKIQSGIPMELRLLRRTWSFKYALSEISLQI